MNQQDELTDLIWLVETRDLGGVTLRDAQQIANAVRTAGYSRPRVVRTMTELEALPVGTVIRDALTNVGELGTTVKCGVHVFWAGNECEDELTDITLPATVLYLPEEKL
ncbi:hypothetical protein GS464_24570 [Rhodococcus hoagii]|nr:hypothetical protein [Prescottella equi]